MPDWLIYFFAAFGAASFFLGVVIALMGVLFIRREDRKLRLENKARNDNVLKLHKARKERNGLENDS